jgi:hypothetical protein
VAPEAGAHFCLVGRVLGHVLPLALGAAVNTRVLASEATISARSPRPLPNALAFGAGAAAPLLLIGSIALVSAHLLVSATSGEQALLASSVVDVLAGASLLVVEAWLLRSRPSAPARRKEASGSSTSGAAWERTALRGAAVMATDLSTLVMFAAAAKDIAVGRLGVAQEAALFLLALGIALVTAWLPPLLFATRPAFARRLLSPLGRAVHRHGRAVAEVLLTALGIYLVTRGALGLA